ncbi:hypothetical protein [Arthrobacter globiformis]|nr:hypothetical protein [Arthrobacter globiformis]
MNNLSATLRPGLLSEDPKRVGIKYRQGTLIHDLMGRLPAH